MSKTDVAHAQIVEEALKAVRFGEAEVHTLSVPEFLDLSTFDKHVVKPTHVTHTINVTWVEYPS